jgi:hypothetical protein
MALKSIEFVSSRELSNGIALKFREVTHRFSWLRLRRIRDYSRTYEAHRYRGSDWVLIPSGAPCSLSLCFALDHLYDTHCEQPVLGDQDP